MLTPNIQPLEDSVLPVCSYHLIGSCLRNSAHHQPLGRNTKPTKYQIEDGGIRTNPVSLYMANIGRLREEGTGFAVPFLHRSIFLYFTAIFLIFLNDLNLRRANYWFKVAPQI
ncbi:hypothetical protein TNCV_729331 [Trichonephila clavipes]|nr:hypothetical protein TNCV_729331 [Trichonephila clavipes]